MWWAFFAELPFLVVPLPLLAHLAVLRRRGVRRIVYPILAAVSFNLAAMPLWTLVTFFALTIASCLAGVGLGILVADRLRKAGVAKLARRRPSSCLSAVDRRPARRTTDAAARTLARGPGRGIRRSEPGQRLPAI